MNSLTDYAGPIGIIVAILVAMFYKSKAEKASTKEIEADTKVADAPLAAKQEDDKLKIKQVDEKIKHIEDEHKQQHIPKTDEERADSWNKSK